jgi:hypothetical protein
MTKQSYVAGTPGDDPTLPNVELILRGRTLQLCYDHNAIAQVENVTGINLMAAAFQVQSASTLRAMLWASIIRQHPDLTIEEVGAWLNPRNFLLVREALLAAWFGSVPEASEGEPGEAQGEASPNASPSPTSGPAAATTSA